MVLRSHTKAAQEQYNNYYYKYTFKNVDEGSLFKNILRDIFTLLTAVLLPLLRLLLSKLCPS